MTQQPGTSGLIFNEPNLWDKSRQGRCAMSLPKLDVDRAMLDESLTGDAPVLPQLSELDVARHYTRLS
ncbi:MAG: aminomethyl-transferring glycine dehydrogenase subunit GcvPB, partial [Desulfobacula sp.]|nr:aminomethyl-transferring glycine dehydrogenase subunit GcvPB [Desulfobacula sp.]